MDYRVITYQSIKHPRLKILNSVLNSYESVKNYSF